MDDQPCPGDDDQSRPERAAWLTGLVLGLPAAIGNLGLSAPTVVLPRAAHDLGVMSSASSWIVAGFTLGVAGSVPIGKLIDTHGSRSTLRLALSALALGSGSTLVAPSLVTFVLARMIEGFGASSIAIVCFATIAMRAGPGGRAAAYAALTAAGSLVAGAGPLIGAWINSLAGWRPVMALPALALLATPPVLRSSIVRTPSQRGLDLPSAALVLILATAVIALLEARATHLSISLVLTLAVVCVLSIGAFVRRARHNPEGLLPRQVERNREIALLTVSAASLFGTYLGLSALFPVLLGATSALHTGVLLLPAAGVAGVTAYVIGAKGLPASRSLLALGISSGGGVLLAALSNASPILIGLAACLIVSPWAGAQVVGLEGVPRMVPTNDQGVALGLFNFLFVIGGSLGAATAGAFLSATGVVAATLLMGTLPLFAIGSAATLSHRATPRARSGGRKGGR